MARSSAYGYHQLNTFKFMTTNSPQAPSVQNGENHETNSHKIAVAVITTSGAYPAEGFELVPLTQPLKVELAHAAKNLGIKDTTGWIAHIGTRELNPDLTYADQGLAGQVEIDYGPREGGGWWL